MSNGYEGDEYVNQLYLDSDYGRAEARRVREEARRMGGKPSKGTKKDGRLKGNTKRGK